MNTDKFTYPKAEASKPVVMTEAHEDMTRARIGIAVILDKQHQHPQYIEERKRWGLDCLKANGRYDSEKPVYFEFEDAKGGKKLKFWQYID